MRTITCLIKCPPPSLANAMKLARCEAYLNKIYVDTWYSGSDENRQYGEEIHVFGDYFKSIEILPVDAESFKLVFKVIPQVIWGRKSFWKDLIVMTLSRLTKEDKELTVDIKVGVS